MREFMQREALLRQQSGIRSPAAAEAVAPGSSGAHTAPAGAAPGGSGDSGGSGDNGDSGDSGGSDSDGEFEDAMSQLAAQP
jgi:hypothetical protein